ncbi:response regulator transcription factor [Streptomyces sp. WAC06614]|uniref:helix-turn-helix transcriptional regulator n=1 Tax=Streptomyces sp. WAC06614 TaxID=2487416 RepID=UPI000F78753F|nr:response regulator transcription factor [Streptomyces sp. WAC06614]RSS80827.1 DNA-binding response regulator [Streptomyces sp. WAC06614]
MSSDHAADVERTLLQARALIESTVSLYRKRPTSGPARPHTDVAVLGEAVEDLVQGARHSVCVAVKSSDAFHQIARQALEDLEPGPVVRLLCASEVADGSLAALTQAPGARFEVRVCEGELRDIVVVDGSSALVRAAAGAASGQATLVSDPAAVRALELLFAGAWSRGRKLDEHLALSAKLRSELTRRILERLRDGYTDDAASRDLNVSLRTYRRHVADIMRELGANSRFQAGVRAVELGLLSE